MKQVILYIDDITSLTHLS